MNFDLSYSFMIPMLQMFAKATHSYGWSIILLTLMVRMLVWPLVAKSTRSMQAMSKLQPQLKAMQAKYKDQPEVLQVKMMEFYKNNKMNPMGGCLPTLIQLPILFALFGTFTGPPFGNKPIDVKINVVAQAQAKEAHRNEVSGNSSPYVSKDGETAKVVVFPGESTVVQGETLEFGTRALQGKLPDGFQSDWRVYPKDTKDPTTVPMVVDSGYKVSFNGPPGEYHVVTNIPGVAKNESFLFINSLGKVAKGTDLLKPANFDSLALILLFGFSMFLSQKFTVSPSSVPEEEMDEQQKVQRDTMKIMPLTMTGMFFFIPLPTGVYLYMVVSNVVQTLQTWLISKTPGPALVVSEEDDVSSPDGPVTMTQNGNTFSVEPGKNGKSTSKSSAGKNGSTTTAESDDEPDDDGTNLKLPKKKKKKKA